MPMTDTIDHEVAGGREITTVHYPKGTPPQDVDVLVVGSGPVGLAAAVELSGRGVSVAVVDQAGQALLGRAGAIGHSARTVEHFRRWGVLQQIRQNWGFPPEWNRGVRIVTSLVGHELVPHKRDGFLESRNGRFSLSPPIRRSQSLLQSVFLELLGTRGVSVVGGWRAESLADDDDGVTTGVVEVATGRRVQIRSRYVIGADGSQSTVRQLAGIEREGKYADEKYYRLVVRTTQDVSDVIGAAPSGQNYVYNQKSTAFLTAISATTWRVTTEPYPLDAEPSEDELLANARADFGFDIDLELVVGTPFHKASRLANTFRKGRVLLAGDAAHVRTPGGNLGEGFGDVANLGWKLAAVVKGHGADGLLDSYDQERRRHNWRIAETALARANRERDVVRQVREIGVPDDGDDSAEASERRDRIGALLANRWGGRGGGTTFDERYDASAVIWYEPDQLATEEPWDPGRYELDPRPGHRSPDGYLDPFGDTLFDRIDGNFALLVFIPDRTIERSFSEAARRRGIPFVALHLDDPEATEIYDSPYVLVRPDQHVAWRGGSLPAGDADAVFDRVLGFSPVAAVGAVSVPGFDTPAPV